jgi:hypothetical protein
VRVGATSRLVPLLRPGTVKPGGIEDPHTAPLQYDCRNLGDPGRKVF